MQLDIHVVQERHAGEQKSHSGQDKQKTYIILNGNFLCLSCPSATFALQHGGFGPREWLVNKGYFLCKFELDIVYQNSHKNLGGLVQFDLKL